MKKQSVILLFSLIFVVLLLVNFVDAAVWPHYVGSDGKSLTGAGWMISEYGRYMWWKNAGCNPILDYDVNPGRYEVVGCDGDDSCCRCAEGYARFGGLQGVTLNDANAKCEPVKFDEDKDGYYVPHEGWIKPIEYMGNNWEPIYNVPEPYDCDDGNPHRDTFCPECGDGNIEEGVEECDDGNTLSGDGCSSICEFESEFCVASLNVDITFFANYTSPTPLHESDMSDYIFVGNDTNPFGQGMVEIPLIVNGSLQLDSSLDNKYSLVPGLSVFRDFDEGGSFVYISAAGFNDNESKEYVKADFEFEGTKTLSIFNGLSPSGQRSFEQVGDGLCSINEEEPSIINKGGDEYTFPIGGTTGSICSTTTDGADRVKVYYDSSCVVFIEGCVDGDDDGYDNCDEGDPGDDGNPGDCDDGDSGINPGENEVCDEGGEDEDCDGNVNEGCDFLSNASWMNMEDIRISEADLNDRVKLSVLGSMLEGLEINYTIYQNIDFWFDWKVAVAQSPDQGFTTWLAGKDEGGDLEDGVYYFIAEIEGLGELRSNYLTILPDSEDNSPPIASILSPVLDENGAMDVYYIGEDIFFNQNSSDEDDFIDFIWNLDDGKIREGDTRNFGNYSFVDSYSVRGQKSIRLDVVDERGLSDYDESAAVIIDPDEDSTYLVALITVPKWGTNITGSEVYFDASGSFAFHTKNCDGNGCDFECAAGGCKNRTGNGIIIEDPNNKRGDYSDFNFSWVFDNGEAFKEGPGEDFMDFNMVFANDGEHEAELTISFNPTESVSTRFNINTFGWDERDPPEWCYENDLGVCGQYNESECGFDRCNVARGGCGETIAELEEFCGDLISSFTSVLNPVDCGCVWVDNEGEGSCMHQKNISSTFFSLLPSELSCIQSDDKGECIDGEMDVTSYRDNYTWIEVGVVNETLLEKCADKLCPEMVNGTVFCGRPIMKLPGFNIYNIVLVVLILVIVYYFILRKKTRKKGRKKR
jgi:cysteine-rich repeat protein